MPGPTNDLTLPLIAAIGAGLVALIAGAFSLIGLVISKEQKISEFRQSWIDSLRTDLGLLVAHAFQVQSYVLMHQPYNPESGWASTRDDYVALNEASLRIKLRLNPGEPESKAVLDLMTELEQLFENLADPNAPKKITSIFLRIEGKAPLLLKKEWQRVKDGELTYRAAKWFASFIILGGALVIGFLLHRVVSIAP